MTRLFADENVPVPLVQALRVLGYDRVTVAEAGKAGQGIPDEAILAYANEEGRTLLTLNRRHFIRLHVLQSDHAGIIVCTRDPDVTGQAARIHAAIISQQPLDGKLVRVYRPQH